MSKIIKAGIECWSCGRFTMIKVSTWYKCTRCGATYVELPLKLGPPLFTRESNGWSGGLKNKPCPKRKIRRKS